MMDLVMNFDTDECLVTAMFDKGNRNDTMEAIGNIDFEGFNRSIKSLSQAAEDLQETASGIKKVTSTFMGGKSTGKTEKKSSK